MKPLTPTEIRPWRAIRPSAIVAIDVLHSPRPAPDGSGLESWAVWATMVGGGEIWIYSSVFRDDAMKVARDLAQAVDRS